MSIVRLILVRELREKLRSKVFIGTNLVLLVLLLAAVIVPAVLDDDAPDALSVVVVGDDAAAIAGIAEQQAASFGYELEVTEVADDATAIALVEDEGADLAVLGTDRLASLEDPPGRAVTMLEGARRLALLDGALRTAGVDEQARAALLQPPPLAVELLADDAESDEEPDEGALFVGLLTGFLLYGLLILYGQQVAQGIVQEKQSRVIEVLLAAVRPTQLLGGKLAGLGLLGLLQIALLGGSGLLALRLTGQAEIQVEAVPTVIAGIVWFVLGYAMYASLFALAAAVVAKIEDLQSAMIGPIILIVASLFVSQLAIAEPDGALASIGGMLPPVAPIYQPLTIALGTATVPRMLLSALGVVATTALLIPLAARVHAGAALSVRQRISVREALRRSRG